MQGHRFSTTCSKMSSQTSGGQLYVVSTPIGNPDDITLRALAVLRTVDIVACEERKVAEKLLRQYHIEKELIELNEHTDIEATVECIKLLASGKNIALISDAGTPLVADPGDALVAAALRYGYAVHVIPGASSILVALVRSGFSTEQFLYAGFLSRKHEQRKKQIQLLSHEPRTVILLDTPYRLVPLLNALAEVMPDRRAYIGCNLTMPNEVHYYGTFAELLAEFAQKHFRGEYVIVFEGNPSKQQWYQELVQGSKEQADRCLATGSNLNTVGSDRCRGTVQSATGVEATPTTVAPMVKESQKQTLHRLRQRNKHKRQGKRQKGNCRSLEQRTVNYTLSSSHRLHRQSMQEEHGGFRLNRKRRRR